MTRQEFEKLTAKAIRGLPREFRDRLDNVIVTVRAEPERAQVRKFGAGLLGLYEGVPLSERGSSYSGAMPDKITLFKNNIEAQCRDGGEVEANIRHTLMHEIAHHFGMDDDELIKKGLY
ncbi:MAG: metallopeptidase family protein [Elusimicrobiota bacterium]|nr:metallopeptidase family protein [Elusimicrobiota bacterium]